MNAKRKMSRDEESYFVSVKNPSETRRHLLESTKRSLISLRNYHKLLLIRQEKSNHLAALRQSVKELTYLNSKLTEKLPDYNSEVMGEFRREKHQEKKAPEKRVEKHKMIDSPKSERTELEKLEESLNSIEEKLKGLQ